MKTRYPKSTGAIFKLCIVMLIAFVAVIYGCRKDISKLGDNPNAIITDPKIAKAKSWYETNFPKSVEKPASQATNSANGDNFDLSQFFKPNWADAKNYTRFNDDVIEMPMDAASVIGLKVGSVPQSNSRSSVLILKRGDTYKAYVMTIVGYTEYINGDTSKLKNNSYGKRDANFSGMVYYTTPQGEFVDGYTYKNGMIKGRLVDNYTATTTGGQAVQSISPNSYQAIQVCTNWYQKVGEVWVYLDTICHTEVIEVPDPSSPLPPATPPSSGGGGGGDSPGNPDPCPPQGAVQNVKNGNIINTLKVMLRDPGDGGFPPPGGGGAPCAVAEDDPCDKVKKQKQNLPANFSAKSTSILTQPGQHEFGSDLNLTSLTSNTYKVTPVTGGQPGKWEANFTWNSDGGYTIGSMHRHQAAGPSPDDIFGMIDDRITLNNIGASEADKQFYENNAYAVVLLNNTTFIVTINPGWWGTVRGMFNEYDRDRITYGNNFSALATEYKRINNVDELSATLAVLKDKFGDAITLSKAAAGSTRFAIVGIEPDGKLIITPCPQ